MLRFDCRGSNQRGGRSLYRRGPCPLSSESGRDSEARGPAAGPDLVAGETARCRRRRRLGPGPARVDCSSAAFGGLRGPRRQPSSPSESPSESWSRAWVGRWVPRKEPDRVANRGAPVHANLVMLTGAPWAAGAGGGPCGGVRWPGDATRNGGMGRGMDARVDG